MILPCTNVETYGSILPAMYKHRSLLPWYTPHTYPLYTAPIKFDFPLPLYNPVKHTHLCFYDTYMFEHTGTFCPSKNPLQTLLEHLAM